MVAPQAASPPPPSTNAKHNMPKKPFLSQSALVMFAGFMALFMAGGSRFAIGLLVKPMADDLGWARGVLGLTVAVFLFVSAVAMFVSGYLSDRLGARVVLGTGAIISAVSVGAMSLVFAPWQAFILYGLGFAVGNGLASISTVSLLITRSFPGRPGIANGAAISGMCLGQLLMIGILAAILVEIGWRQVFIWLGVLNLLLLPIILIAMRREAPAGLRAVPGESDGLTLWQAWQTQPFWLLVLAYAICGFQDFFVATHVVAFATDRGVGTLLAGNLLAFMGLTGFVGVVMAGAWSDRSGPAWPFLACFVIRAILFVLILSMQNEVMVAAFALLFGFTFFVTAPLTVILVRDAFGTREIGTIVGLITMIHNFAGGLGAYIGAALFDRFGSYDSTFWTMALVSLIVIGVMLAFMSARPVAR